MYASVLVGHVSDGVEDPVHLCAPSSVMSVVHLFGEILQSLLLSFLCHTHIKKYR